MNEITMHDQYLLDTPLMHDFIGQVQQIINSTPSVSERLAAIRPHFSQLMADQSWLPAEFRQPAEHSSMGGGIATWLMYRAGDGNLSFFTLVVPPGSSTPIHDHLAWGLVGLYVGEQNEDVFERLPGNDALDGHAPLRLVRSEPLKPGTFYELIPPDGDIHRVTTTGSEPSISLHLLGNDTGCVWRHSFDLKSGQVQAFRSGYTNQACKDNT